jgi:hypothetical protein
VRKSIEFSQSKVQIFGGKEEDILIENLSNNSYKITAVFPELNLTKEVTSQELKVNDSKVPLLQFSSFFPHIKVLLDVKVPKINLNNADKITNLNLNLSFAFGEITGETSFKIGEKLTFNLKGVMQNYENTFRKGLIKASIDGVGVDFSSFDYFINFIYKGNKSEDFKLKFNAIIAGEEAVFEDISFIGNEIEVKNSKFEFNLYLKERGYFADINIEKLNLENIKLTIPAALKQPNGDLFRILFDYLKFKDFSYIKINCKSCKLNEETYKIAFKANTINSKIELEELSVNGAKIGVFIGGILDIRNPQSNIANLNVEVTKWEDFEFDKFLNISSIIEKFEEIKIPSFDGFAGSIIFNGKSISNKFNKIEAMEVRLRMNAGILKENTSKIKINGVETENFINMEIIMRSARPEISASLNLPSVEVSGILAYILNRKEFTKINGFAGVGASFTTRGVLAKDLVQNISAIFEIKSNKIEINNFAIDEIARVLTNPLISFKSLTNTQIQNQMNNKGFYELSSKIAFSENTFNVENLDLKSQGSNSIFVGKLTLLPQNKYLLQMVGKTATTGADLNSNLNGLMPVYITSAISNKEEEIETKFDYSQVNKYSEARRVLYK